MFKTKYFLGALVLFTIFGFGVAKAETDDAAVRSGLYYVLQALQEKVSALTQTAQVRSESPTTLTQSAYYLPQGTFGQTLYHDGSSPASWKATSNLYNDGQNIILSGVGSSTSAAWATFTATMPVIINKPGSSNLSHALQINAGTLNQNGSVTGNNSMDGRLTVGTGTLYNLNGVQLYVNNNGMRLGGSNTRPSCASNYRGVIWYTQGATSDAISACMLTASSTYAWKDL